MATPFQIAWTFLKSNQPIEEPSPESPERLAELAYLFGIHENKEYDNDSHRAKVEGGEHLGEKLWNHGMAPRKKTNIPSPDDAQDNYALDESLNEEEEEEDYYEQDKDDTNVTPDSQEEMYNRFSQDPNTKGY